MSNNIKINIQELNLTTARPIPETSDIVYVPGLSPNYDNSNVNRPKLYKSALEFEQDFIARNIDGKSFKTNDKGEYVKTIYKYTADDVKCTYLTGSDTGFIKENEADRSYHYAHNLLSAGIQVYYECVQTETTVTPANEVAEGEEPDTDPVVATSALAGFYTELPTALTKLLDKNEYSVKYITSGGYPTFDVTVPVNGKDTDLAEKMLQVASNRGDAIALIDHKYNTSTPLDPSNAKSLYAAVCGKEYADAIAGYGAMFTPWATYDKVMLPASYAYLSCLARSLKTTPNFVAIAGVARGLVSGITELNTGKQVLTSTIAENYQPKRKDTAPGSVNTVRSINAITQIRPYGLCIWGNRTLASIEGGEPTAINFLNTRAMLCDIKKVAYTTAKTLMFEQDSDKLWLRFKSGVSGLLDQLKTGYGIKDYKILRKEASGRGRMAAKIQVYPLYAIEFFEIDIVVSDDETTVE